MALTLGLWTFVVWSPMVTFHEFELFGVVVGLLGPLAMVPVVLFAPPRLQPAARMALVWTALVAGSVLAGLLVVGLPILALVIPFMIPLAGLCWRFPTFSMGILLFLSGAALSLNAYLGGFQTQRAIDIILPGLWMALVWAVLTRRRERAFMWWPGVALVAAYVLLTLFEVFVSPDLVLGFKSFRLSAWLMAIVLLLGYAGWGWRTYQRLARLVVLVALVVGAYAVFRWITAPTAAEYAQAQKLTGAFNTVNGELKLFAPFTSRTQLGGWTSEVVPFLLMFALSVRWYWKIPAIAAAGLCTAALFGSDVRAALAAMVLGILATLAAYQASRAYRGLHLGTTALVFMVILIGGVFLFTQTTGGTSGGKQRYENILHPKNDDSFGGRLQKWGTALPEIDKKPFGHGMGTAGGVQKLSGKYLNAASIDLEGGYLNVAFQQGWGVLALYLLAIISLAAGLVRRGIATFDKERAAIAIGAFGSLVSFGVMNALSGFNEGLPTAIPWILAGLGVAAFSTARGRQPQPGPVWRRARFANPHHAGNGASSPPPAPVLTP